MSGHVRSSFHLLGFGEAYYGGADRGNGFLVAGILGQVAAPYRYHLFRKLNAAEKFVDAALWKLAR
jgi:hypothetical protein